jgi:hypothetical protein
MAPEESFAEQVGRERERLRKIEFPEWLPAVIKRSLQENLENFALDSNAVEIALRLAQHEDMEPVWGELEKPARNVPPSWVEERRRAKYRRCWGPSPDDNADVVLLSYFETAHFLAWAKVSMFRQADITKLRAEWLHKAKELDTLSKWLNAQPTGHSASLMMMRWAKTYAGGVERAARFCAHVAEQLSQIPSDFIIPRDQGNIEARSFIRALAVHTHWVFGDVLHGTLASTGTVALKTKIDKEKVIDWCVDLKKKRKTNQAAVPAQNQLTPRIIETPLIKWTGPK